MPRRCRYALLALMLLTQLVASPASTGRVVAQDASPIATGDVDTSGWVEHLMPYLGYSVRLPAEFEPVDADPAAPVASYAGIVERDPATAAALQAAAQHLSDNGGLFDAMGLWSVEPASLLQLGVLAGTPYRISEDAFAGIVEESVLERASELEDPVIDPISVPAGEGFVATYLDGMDLAQHREVHLRTPTDRYLVLASTLPGIADPALEQTVVTIAESLRALPDSAADRPAPEETAADHADPHLEATLPEHVPGSDLTRRSLGGESLVSGTDSVSGSIAGELGRLVAAPGDVSFALAVPSEGIAPLLISAYRLRGVTPDDARAFIDSFPDDIWSDTRVAGHDVRVSVEGDSGNRSWLYVAAGPDGDAVLYQVDAGQPAIGIAAVAALP